ncbi:hypothetical protein [Ochrobactrum sp. Marseille-Q0166]|uniref:hypothetical protein n=1 Tax=Ochrobactrum sp. Marseille-Q0166 TaxID=2761105 RepID=UPI001655BA00|nr:hypothetical protein [Ochrobactrum sp. Marseille-Q0166]MBC8719043.1 hypothetical protein [Ochrobactrum sp. Marseille-Q0166]
MLAALIHDEFVSNIIVVDETTDLTEFAGYIRCADDVAIGWSYANGEFVAPPSNTDPLVPVVIIIPALTLWRRMNNDEAEQVNDEMQKRPFRMRKIFETAPNFRSDDELWPLLEQIANELFGAD